MNRADIEEMLAGLESRVYNQHFYLNEDHTYVPCDIGTYNAQMLRLKKSNRRHVAVDEIKGYLISTVWLGVNSFLRALRPLVFETMVFDNNLDEVYIARYSTWEEAEEGHKKAVQWVLEEAKPLE